MIMNINKSRAQAEILSQKFPPAAVFPYFSDMFYIITADPDIGPEGRLAAAIENQSLSDD
jgi:hypothetical protein